MTEPLTIDAAITRASVAAAALGLGRQIDNWALALLILALAGLAWLDMPILASIALLVSLAAGATQKLLSLRVAFDERLFRQWALSWRASVQSMPSADMIELDQTLFACGLVRQQAATPRDLDSRVRGALALVKMQAMALTVQLVAVTAAALLRV